MLNPHDTQFGHKVKVSDYAVSVKPIVSFHNVLTCEVKVTCVYRKIKQ